MDRLRQILANISKQLGTLTVVHKLLVGAVVVVIVMSLLLVGLLTGKADSIELLPGAAAPDQQRAASHLATVDIKHTLRDGVVFVRAADAPRARAMLQEAGALPGDKALLFANILEKQSWTNSRQVNEQTYRIALQNELARTIENFAGVKAATVLIDIPEPSGLGRSVRRATAAATVETESGEAMPQGMVDAVAAFIAGASAGLDAERVRVIDAATGRQRKALSDAETLPTTYLEHATKVETQAREKILDLLSYIPGVVVAVTAQVDVTRVTAQVQTNLPERQGTVSLVKKTTDTTNSSTQSAPGSESGFAANQAADINRGSATPGNSTEQNSNTTEFENHVGTRSETILDPKGHPTMVAVSVSVPRGFIASLLKASGVDEPTEQQIQERFDTSVRPAITQTLLPQLRVLNQRGDAADDAAKMAQDLIGVSMIPMDGLFGPGAQVAGLGGIASGSGGGGGLLTGSGLIEKGVLGALSLMAMTMMIVMVKKAGKKAPMPSVEELVGLPPQLEAADAVIGEADEGDTPMAGIEVDEEQVQAQKMLEQVEELVQQSPETAARLLNRWIDSND